jgi:hypothetical protein
MRPPRTGWHQERDGRAQERAGAVAKELLRRGVRGGDLAVLVDDQAGVRRASAELRESRGTRRRGEPGRPVCALRHATSLSGSVRLVSRQWDGRRKRHLPSPNVSHLAVSSRFGKLHPIETPGNGPLWPERIAFPHRGNRPRTAVGRSIADQEGRSPIDGRTTGQGSRQESVGRLESPHGRAAELALPGSRARLARRARLPSSEADHHRPSLPPMHAARLNQRNGHDAEGPGQDDKSSGLGVRSL